MKNRVYLNASFNEKEEVKRLGARWDAERKEWYFTERKQITYLKFSKWLKTKDYQNPSIQITSNVSIKIGKSVFSDLINSIQNAKERVYISSTYLGEGTAELLEELQRRITNVKVLFSTKENIIKDKNILKHFVGCKVQQDFVKKELNNENINELNRRILREKKISFYTIIIFLILVISYFFYHYSKYILYGSTVFLVVLNILIYGMIDKYQNIKWKLQNEDFFYLKFFPKIKHKAVVENDRAMPLPHLKLYIVDEIAYIGSLNFSNSGCFFNIESLVEIREKDKVDNLVEYFERLYNFYNEIGIDTIGKNIYNLEEEKLQQLKQSKK